MRLAAIQSCYLPWKGYFDIIGSVDVFVFLDDVQYTSRDWRNRNLFKTPHGKKWLSVPVGHVGREKKIDEVEIPEDAWQGEHLRLIHQYYSKAPCMKAYEALLSSIFIEKRWTNLSALNQFATIEICKTLGINSTLFVDSRSLGVRSQKEERLIEICKKLGATTYLSGPSAANYITPENWEREGIGLEWKGYSYPEYPQLYPPFDHYVSVLDLLFMTGENAPDFIWDRKRNA